MAKLSIENLRRQLLAERRRLLADRERVSAWHQEAIQSEATGELSDYDNHPADVATETFEREKSSVLESNIEDLLNKVETALRKIEEGTYGRCEICGGEIRPERLEALPYAELCLDCQARIETQ